MLYHIVDGYRLAYIEVGGAKLYPVAALCKTLTVPRSWVVKYQYHVGAIRAYVINEHALQTVMRRLQGSKLVEKMLLKRSLSLVTDDDSGSDYEQAQDAPPSDKKRKTLLTNVG